MLCHKTSSNIYQTTEILQSGMNVDHRENKEANNYKISIT